MTKTKNKCLTAFPTINKSTHSSKYSLTFQFLNINENEIKSKNINPVLIYYKQKYNDQYAFLTDHYCYICTHLYNIFKINEKDLGLDIRLNSFLYHLTFEHNV